MMKLQASRLLSNAVWGASLLTLLTIGVGGAIARDYLIGTDDILRVAFYDRPELSGEFRVRPPGVLSLPLVGEIAVLGLTLADLEREIAARLLTSADRKGYFVNVEIKEYRPFFIVGDVKQPGKYPCGPDMTVLRAVAIAGGFKDLDDEGFAVRAEVYRAEEKLRQLRETMGLNLLREARYRAEATEGADLDVPEVLSAYLDSGRRAQAVAAERAVLQERRQALQREIEALERGKGVFVEEINAHRAKIIAETERARLLEVQRKELDTGKERLVPKMVLWGLEQDIVTVEGNKRELDAYIARARQQMEEKDRAVLRLGNERGIEIAAGLKQATDDMAQAQASIEETERFLARAQSWILRDQREAGSAPGAFAIMREDTEGPIEIAAKGHTEVMPGDVITVLPVLRPARYR
jgi:polysaccharide biosynthesis/export protein ExoF